MPHIAKSSLPVQGKKPPLLAVDNGFVNPLTGEWFGAVHGEPLRSAASACSLRHIYPSPSLKASGSAPNPLYDLVEFNDTCGDDEKRFHCVSISRSMVKVQRRHRSVQPPKQKFHIRSRIFHFSQKSRLHLRRVCMENGFRISSQFLCTYHTKWPLDGLQVKRDVNAFRKLLSRYFVKKLRLVEGIDYLWVLEFQERGAPHIHFFSNLPISNQVRMNMAWFWLVASRQQKDMQAFNFHAHPKNFFSWKMKSSEYLIKEYVDKAEQKEVPAQFHNVGRWWGSSRSMKIIFTQVETHLATDVARVCRRLAAKRYHRCNALFEDVNGKANFLRDQMKEDPSGLMRKQLWQGARENFSWLDTKKTARSKKRIRTDANRIRSKVYHHMEKVAYQLLNRSLEFELGNVRNSFGDFIRRIEGKHASGPAPEIPF